MDEGQGFPRAPEEQSLEPGKGARPPTQRDGRASCPAEDAVPCSGPRFCRRREACGRRAPAAAPAAGPLAGRLAGRVLGGRAAGAPRSSAKYCLIFPIKSLLPSTRLWLPSCKPGQTAPGHFPCSHPFPSLPQSLSG